MPTVPNTTAVAFAVTMRSPSKHSDVSVADSVVRVEAILHNHALQLQARQHGQHTLLQHHSTSCQ
jgi:hypothetical protein